MMEATGGHAMRTLQNDRDAETTFRAILGFVVLGMSIVCANVVSLPIDTEPYTVRLEDASVRQLFTAGFITQLVTGIWLSLSLLLDARFLRFPLIGWFVSLTLYLAPVPTLLQDPAAALLPIAVVAVVALVGWALDGSLRERTAR